MGTRGLTFVCDESGEKIINLYRQYDSYPTGHGQELAEFLNGVQFNGMGCLAASMVAYFKQTPGGFYIHPTDITDCGQDYEYHVYEKKDDLYIEVYNCGCNFFGMSSDTHELIFKGTLKEFTKFCKEKEIA